MISENKRQAKQAKPTAIDEAREILRAAIPQAAAALVACLEAEDPAMRLRAAVAILNRAGLTEATGPKYSHAAKVVGGEIPDQSPDLDLLSLGLG